MTLDVVLIAPAAALPELTARLAPAGAVRAFPDTDALAALDAVFEALPRQIALERGFADSLPGRAFLNRVADDPFARECLIRIVEATVPSAPAVAPESVTPSAAPPGADAEPAQTAPSPRAVPRLAVRPDTAVQVDGTAMTLVDLSVDGMQVLGSLTLRPNQAVRVTCPDGGAGLRLRARVAWANFEMGGSGPGPRYRAGLQFVDADRAVLDALVARLTTVTA